MSASAKASTTASSELVPQKCIAIREMTPSAFHDRSCRFLRSDLQLVFFLEDSGPDWACKYLLSLFGFFRLSVWSSWRKKRQLCYSFFSLNLAGESRNPNICTGVGVWYCKILRSQHGFASGFLHDTGHWKKTNRTCQLWAIQVIVSNPYTFSRACKGLVLYHALTLRTQWIGRYMNVIPVWMVTILMTSMALEITTTDRLNFISQLNFSCEWDTELWDNGVPSIETSLRLSCKWCGLQRHQIMFLIQPFHGDNINCTPSFSFQWKFCFPKVSTHQSYLQ